MRLPYFLLLASAALLAGSVGPSAAFQTAGKTFVSTPSRQSALAALPFPSTDDATSNRSLLSLLGPLRTPKHCKPASRRTKDDIARKISNKQLLALVTTSCLAAIARPSAARAAVAAFLDPVTLTYCEVPGLGLLLSGLSTYNLGAIEALRRKPPAFFIKAFLLTFSLAWTLGGLVYSLGLNEFEPMRYKGANARKAAKEEAKAANWRDYSQRLLGASRGMVKKAKRLAGKRSVSGMDRTLCGSDLQLIMTHAAKDQETADEATKLDEAGRLYRERQYRLHHHPVHVVQTKAASPAYLDSLSINEASRHDVPGGYLDTISGAKQSTWNEYAGRVDKAYAPHAKKGQKDGKFEMAKNMLTWEDYKHLAGELQERKNEVHDLKQEVEHLRSLLQIEQSIHQAVPTEAPPDASVTADPTVDELKAFEEMAREYEETVKKASVATDEADATKWLESQNGLGSGIK
ncbi:hypothetical protein ACHAXT_009646 [Thalassiosira profunda]